MAWLFLFVGGCFEIMFTFCLGKAKESTGYIELGWYGGFAISLAISMALLIKATQTLPLGTAYAVWTGIGAVGTALIGIFYFKEPATLGRVFFLFALITSIIGLKYYSE